MSQRGTWHVAPDQGALHPLEQLTASVSCSVHRAGHFPRLSRGWRLPERVTPNHVLFVITSGAATFWVGDRRYPVGAGDAVLIPPQLTQRAQANPSSVLGAYVVHFSARLHGVVEAPTLLGLPVAISGGRRFGLEAACRRLVAELGSGRPGSALAAGGECAVVVARLWRAAVEDGTANGPDGVGQLHTLIRLKPAFDLIERRHADGVRVEQLAAALHLHPIYFARLFRQATGVSPAQYLGHYRLGRVRELLLGTDLGLAEIARRTGYATPSYLARAFRRAEGMSPGEYRRAGPRQ